jgi:UDP-N-acetylmuramoyl-L-alanyl-D-glutamate--2,6-diaminopimelate ligase
MKLNELFPGQPGIEIKNLTDDSRVQKPSSVFFCIKGYESDGHLYTKQAIENGAVAVVYSESLEEKDAKTVYIHVNDVTAEMNRAAALFNGYPSRNMYIAGVTGTNGKSTIASIYRSVLDQYEPTGYIGTIAIEYGSVKRPPLLTSPDAISLQSILHDMKEAGMKGCALECSSIGLDQGRLDAVDFDAAAFTNLTYDHLDYHKNMRNYFHAKKKLFDSLKKDAVAVTNIDDPYGTRITEDCVCPVFTYGIKNNADYQAVSIRLEKDRTFFTLVYKDKNYSVETNLRAMFNVYNVLADIALLHEKGLPLEEILPALKNLPAVAGRMHMIDQGQPFNIVCDFAHTPDGIEKVCHYAQTLTPAGKHIIAVTGSAGKRDTAKRPVFGQILSKYCDEIVLTEDDPRDADPAEIAQEIASGITGSHYQIVIPREDAIACAVNLAQPHDTVIIIGKGDEKFMYKGAGKVPYCGDDTAAEKALKEKGYGE